MVGKREKINFLFNPVGCSECPNRTAEVKICATSYNKGVFCYIILLLAIIRALRKSVIQKVQTKSPKILGNAHERPVVCPIKS